MCAAAAMPHLQARHLSGAPLECSGLCGVLGGELLEAALRLRVLPYARLQLGDLRRRCSQVARERLRRLLQLLDAFG